MLNTRQREGLAEVETRVKRAGTMSLRVLTCKTLDKSLDELIKMINVLLAYLGILSC